MAWGAIFIIYFNKAFLGVIVYCVFSKYFSKSKSKEPQPYRLLKCHTKLFLGPKLGLIFEKSQKS